MKSIPARHCLLALTQVATVATCILAADGGAIGSFMLDGEAITFAGDSVRIQLAAGAQLGTGNYVTGFTVTAFDGYANAGFIGLTSAASATAHRPDQRRARARRGLVVAGRRRPPAVFTAVRRTPRARAAAARAHRAAPGSGAIRYLSRPRRPRGGRGAVRSHLQLGTGRHVQTVHRRNPPGQFQLRPARLGFVQRVTAADQPEPGRAARSVPVHGLPACARPALRLTGPHHAKAIFPDGRRQGAAIGLVRPGPCLVARRWRSLSRRRVPPAAGRPPTCVPSSTCCMGSENRV